MVTLPLDASSTEPSGYTVKYTSALAEETGCTADIEIAEEIKRNRKISANPVVNLSCLFWLTMVYN